jgi:hypothetical protein
LPKNTLGAMGFPHDQQFPRAPAFAESKPRTTLALTPIVCIECRRPWLADSERWRMKVTDDAPPETVPYCPGCATREFGPT